MSTGMRRRVQGIAFVVVLAVALGLAVGKYAGAFGNGVPVTLKVERVGNQLVERGDVKVRGLVVGTIEEVTTNGAGATVALSLRRDKVAQIPSNVSARLVPKTLFGEKYVSLVLPEGTRGAPIAAGDVIAQDRSRPARELDRVLDGLVPLLQAVEPQDLATTLGALSQALSGRGANLGDTLVRLHDLVAQFNTELPDLQADISELADFSGNLADAAPDLLDALEDFTVTSRTIVEQRTNLRELLGGLTQASDDLRGFLAANGDNLIGLAASSRPTLESLARYSPEFPCLFSQLAGLIERGEKAFGKGTGRPGLYITLEIVNNNGKYVPNRDEPEYLDDRGPRCYPILPLGPQQPPDGPFKDGSTPPPAPVGTPTGDADELGVVPASSILGPASGPSASMLGPASGPSAYTGMGIANSPGEQRMVAELIAARDGGSPSAVPTWSTMLVGPLYRGSEVALT